MTFTQVWLKFKKWVKRKFTIGLFVSVPLTVIGGYTAFWTMWGSAKFGGSMFDPDIFSLTNILIILHVHIIYAALFGALLADIPGSIVAGFIPFAFNTVIYGTIMDGIFNLFKKIRKRRDNSLALKWISKRLKTGLLLSVPILAFGIEVAMKSGEISRASIFDQIIIYQNYDILRLFFPKENGSFFQAVIPPIILFPIKTFIYGLIIYFIKLIVRKLKQFSFHSTEKSITKTSCKS